MTEQQLHKSVAAYLTHALRPPIFWTTFPAGGGGRVRGAQLKGAGLKSGVPDILVFVPRTGSSVVIGIELKTAKGTLSPVQKDTQGQMMLASVRCRIARSVEDVENILITNDVPVHATAGGRMA